MLDQRDSTVEDWLVTFEVRRLGLTLSTCDGTNSISALDVDDTVSEAGGEIIQAGSSREFGSRSTPLDTNSFDMQLAEMLSVCTICVSRLHQS